MSNTDFRLGLLLLIHMFVRDVCGTFTPKVHSHATGIDVKIIYYFTPMFPSQHSRSVIVLGVVLPLPRWGIIIDILQVVVLCLKFLRDSVIVDC